MDAVNLEYQIEAALQDMPAAITNLIEKARAVEATRREIDRIDREIIVARSQLAGLAAQALRQDACWREAGDAGRTAVARRFLFMRWCCRNGVVSDYGRRNRVEVRGGPQ